MKPIFVILLSAVLMCLGTSNVLANQANPSNLGSPEVVMRSAININVADVMTLATLPGIGKKKAQAIIDYRELNGPIKSIEQLANVKGLGEKTVAKFSAQIEF